MELRIVRRILFFCIGWLALTSCHNEARERLDLAGQLVQEHPDSAREILKGVNGAELNSSELRAIYALRKVQTRYYGDDPEWLSSDSLINVFIDYFSANFDHRDTPMAFYIAGVTELNKKNMNRAIEYLNESVIASEEQGDSLRMSLANNRLSELYYWLGRYPKALSHARRCAATVPYATEGRGKVYRLDAFNELSRMYFNTCVFDSAILMADKVLKESSRTDDPRNFFAALGLKARSMNFEGHYKKSLELYDTVLTEASYLLDYGDLNYIGAMALKGGDLGRAIQLDSMVHALDTTTYWLSANIKAAMGKPEEALELIRKELDYRAGVKGMAYTGPAGDEFSVYKELLARHENDKARKRARWYYTMVVFFGVVCLWAVDLIIDNRLRRREQVKEQEEALVRLTSDLEHLRSEYEKLQVDTLEYEKGRLDILNGLVLKLKRLENGKENDKTLKKVFSISQDIFQQYSTEDQIEALADRLTGGLITRVRKSSLADKKDLVFHTALMVLGYTPRALGALMGVSAKTVSNIRSRIIANFDEEPSLKEELEAYLKGKRSL